MPGRGFERTFGFPYRLIDTSEQDDIRVDVGDRRVNPLAVCRPGDAAGNDHVALTEVGQQDNSLVSVEIAHRLVVEPSISGIASRLPSGDGNALEVECPAGTRNPPTRPMALDGSSSGLATRISKSHAPVAWVRTFA